jgi:hypothetical protein
LKLFNLSSFPLSFSQLLFRYHILNSPNETFSLCSRSHSFQR